MAGPKTTGIGIVGMGFMGTTHLEAARRLRGARVRAIMTSDPRKARGDFRAVGGNFGSGLGKISLAGIRVHADLDSLLADPAVDLVDLCLPTHCHRDASIQALRYDKHVLVEKPIAVTLPDATRMLRAAERAGRLLLVAQVLKFFPEFAFLSEAIRSRRWGKLLRLHTRRVISKPNWEAGSWLSSRAKSGGMVIDLHIHDTDFVTYLFGKPKAVTSQGVVRKGQVDFVHTKYHYDRDVPLITTEGGWINRPSLPFEHGFEAFFEKASCYYNSTHAPAPVCYEQRKAKEIRPKKLDAFRAELQAAVDAVHSGKVPPTLSPETAKLSLKVCLAEERSAIKGRRCVVS